MATPPPIDFDHVAIAVERWADAYDPFVTQLGGRFHWRWRDPGVPFAPLQLEYANGMRLEVLEPQPTERDPFLRRFLDANGPGAHHLTFKVADLDDAIDRARGLGLEPVGIDRSDPGWMEAFLHPKDTGLGIVVQCAQATPTAAPPPAPPADFPPTLAPPTALERVVIAVREFADAERVFVTLLGGVAQRTDGEQGVQCSWPGPGTVEIITPESPDDGLDRFIGRWGGRVHHLQFAAAPTRAERTSTRALPANPASGVHVVVG